MATGYSALVTPLAKYLGLTRNKQDDTVSDTGDQSDQNNTSDKASSKSTTGETSISSNKTHPISPGPAVDNIPFYWQCNCEHITEDPLTHISRCTNKKQVHYSPVKSSLGVDGCFSGNSLAYTPGGRTIRICNLKRDDIVSCNSDGGLARVSCVLKFNLKSKKSLVVPLEGGCTLTPMHPVIHNGAWRLPKDLGEMWEMNMENVYNVLLDGPHHTMVVDGTICSVLGTPDTGIYRSEFWGNRCRVMESMERVDPEGFAKGLVQVGGTVRTSNGLVCGLKALERASLYT